MLERTGSAAVLVLDIDGFTAVNAVLGHEAGNVLLGTVAGRISARLDAPALVGTLGADGFGVLLPLGTAEDARALSRTLLDAVADPVAIDGDEIEVEASIGAAIGPEHGRDAARLIQRAELAVLAAKRAGSGYELFDATRGEAIPEPFTLLADIRRGLAQDEFSLHYQPQVSFRDPVLVGMEALLRWHHPRRGLVLPAAYLPVLERTRAMRALSRYVLERALGECSICVPHGGHMRVSVNLSMRDLRDPELPDVIAALLERQGGGAVWLSIELTETAVMADAERARHALERLRAIDVRLAIDDFGTGYSSLAYLASLPVHALKIDRSIAGRVATDAPARAIARAIVELAHGLGVEVVAEGVEDREGWDVLAELGCDTAQGYYVARPMPRDELERWMARSAWRPPAATDVGTMRWDALAGSTVRP